MESSQHVVDRLRALEYQQLLRDAARERLTISSQRSDPVEQPGVRPAVAGVIAWWRRQTLSVRVSQRLRIAHGG